MSGSNDASSPLNPSSRTSYTAQLPPEQIRWLRGEAEKRDTTVDQFVRAILAKAVDGPETETSSPSRSAGDRADGDTVLSRLRQAEETLQALQAAGDPDNDVPQSSSTEDAPRSTVTEDASSDDEDPPSSMFDLAEKTL